MISSRLPRACFPQARPRRSPASNPDGILSSHPPPALSTFHIPYPLCFQTLANSFALCKIISSFFSSTSALFRKNHRGWGGGLASPLRLQVRDVNFHCYRTQDQVQ